jgi:hypothetical protein
MRSHVPAGAQPGSVTIGDFNSDGKLDLAVTQSILSLTTTSLSIEGHDVDDQVGSAIQQHDVSSDQDVCALRRRRSQAHFQILGYGLQAFLEAWRKCATHHQLSL